MLIDGQKWACEACIRGHRVTSCKHHDRPLIRIKRKGRPFATCTICNATPCTAPAEHARAKRDAELKCPKKASHGRLYPRHHNPTGFLPIAPRPGPGSASTPVSRSSSVSVSGRKAKTSTSSGAVNKSMSKSRSGSKLDESEVGPSRSTSDASSAGLTPVYHDAVGAGEWSGSEGEFSGNESSGHTASFSALRVPVSASEQTLSTGQGCSLPNSAPGSLYEYPIVSEAEAATALFDPAYSLLPATSAVSDPRLVQTLPMVSPFEGVNPFEFPIDPALALGDGGMGYLDEIDMDMELPAAEEVFHVEDWSRYMWSAETGFEHIDTGFPPVSG